jgi:hypothetical protein
MTNPKMTVAQLRERLSCISAEHDNAPVTVWLPGSRIDLAGFITLKANLDGEVLIEGNLRPGSALEQ